MIDLAAIYFARRWCHCWKHCSSTLDTRKLHSDIFLLYINNYFLILKKKKSSCPFFSCFPYVINIQRNIHLYKSHNIKNMSIIYDLHMKCIHFITITFKIMLNPSSYMIIWAKCFLNLIHTHLYAGHISGHSLLARFCKWNLSCAVNFTSSTTEVSKIFFRL